MNMKSPDSVVSSITLVVNRVYDGFDWTLVERTGGIEMSRTFTGTASTFEEAVQDALKQ